MVIRIKLSTLAWTIFTLPLFPLTLMPWLFRKAGDIDSSDAWIGASVLSVFAVSVVVAIYVLSLFSASSVAEVNPLGVPVEDGTKFEVTVDHHSAVSFLPWSWSHQKTYVRWVSPDKKVYWIDPETRESFINHEWEKEFEHQSLPSEQIKAILAE